MHNISLLVLMLFCIYTKAGAQGEIEKLPDAVNTSAYDETSPVISRDGHRLFFTRTADPDFESTLPNAQGEWAATVKDEAYTSQLSAIYSEIAGQLITNPVSSILNQDIWYTDLQESSFGAPQHPGYPINNALPNSLVSTGMMDNEYVLLNEFYQDGSMYAGFSRVQMGEGGYESFPRPMYIYGFNITRSDVNMTMTSNGHVIIFSMEGAESEGQNDLYVSFYLRENVWSTPVHMGAVLNSPFQETTPFITPDKRYLYFSSNRPGGIGGNDIYRAERLDYSWLKWSVPMLVEGDVNSEADDSQPYFDPSATYMYFTSKRDGSSDIFREHLAPKQRLSRPVVIRGKIVNEQTHQMTRGEIFWGQQSSKDYLEYFNSYNGEFEVTLTEYEPYKFQLRKPNHKAQQVMIDPRVIDKQGRDTVDVVFFLQPKADVKSQDPKLISIKGASASPPKEELRENYSSFYDIFFLKGQDVMLQRSHRALADLLDKLEAQPTMEIRIIGHTDNVGDEAALKDLSIRRAIAIKRFLVKKGIADNRIQTSGLGADMPRYSNDTENNRQKNRRVEIKVIRP